MRQREFEELALPLLDSLYNFARWIAGDPDEARDLVQETFARALKGRGSFEAGTNFRAWMFRILRNTFLTSHAGLERRNTSQEGEEGWEDAAVSFDTPELALIRSADVDLVRRGIELLSPGLREVLILADLEEMKYQDVAKVLGVPIGTVMSRLWRARKQLRRQITEALEPKRKLGAKS